VNNAAATSVRARPATDDDRDWLFDLHERAHRELVERAYGPWDEDRQRGFFVALVNEHDVFVFSDGDQDVGAVYLGERDGDMWLELVEILPELQRRGYGTTALRWAVTRAGAQGVGVLLQVHRLNADAHRLYLSEGFCAAGENETHHRLRKAVRD
jgi:GNAT superfamily N-acetyltransferase